MLPFSQSEYQDRYRKTLLMMEQSQVDTLIINDPCGIVWLTGYDAWSFYLPQCVVVSPKLTQPLWIGRAMDVTAVHETSWLQQTSIEAYGDEWVQISQRSASTFIAEVLVKRRLHHGRVGIDFDCYYFTPRQLSELRDSLTQAMLIDLGAAIRKLRAVKSAAELAVMDQAAQIASQAIQTALQMINVGVRECDIAAAVIQQQIAGTPENGGFYTSSPPFLLRGKRGASAHLSWGQGKCEKNETVYIELLGCRYRYQVCVSRAIYLGAAPANVLNAARASEEAINVAMDTARPGITCSDLAQSMLKVFKKHGIEKNTRCGYAIGIAYPPTSGERTMSLHPDDHTPLEAGMTFHLHPNLIFADWGIYITESMVVTPHGARAFTQLPRALLEKN
jgi:ectoine hydrolase